MLIVTADDFGSSPGVTDAIVTAGAVGGISTTSALVFMPDTERAAEHATGAELPVGLHLNLSLPYGASDIPGPVRERQLRMTDLFDSTSPPAGAGPRLGRGHRTLLRDVLADQFERFRNLFGEPDHVNGHHHVHLHREVLELLPGSLPTRMTPTQPERLDQRPGRRERRIRRRFASRVATVHLRLIHPDLGGVGLGALERARAVPLEVFCHPSERRELDALTSSEWLSSLRRLPLGPYAEIASAATVMN